MKPSAPAYRQAGTGRGFPARYGIHIVPLVVGSYRLDPAGHVPVNLRWSDPFFELFLFFQLEVFKGGGLKPPRSGLIGLDSLRQAKGLMVGPKHGSYS
jgi:hypothetical protein